MTRSDNCNVFGNLFELTKENMYLIYKQSPYIVYLKKTELIVFALYFFFIKNLQV